MSYKEIKGNIFNSKAMSVVNTVNCVGAMGKGIALDFKLRFPEMFKEYQRVCFEGLLRPGQILPYRKSSPMILNFAIKDNWKDPSRVEWIEESLQKFVLNYKRLGITSIAFPWMGAMNGGISLELIKNLTRRYLSNLDDIDIEVYEFDPDVPCGLFKSLQSIINTNKFSIPELVELSKIKYRYWDNIFLAINDSSVRSLNNLCNYVIDGKKIIGKTNIERLFVFLAKYNRGELEGFNSMFDNN